MISQAGERTLISAIVPKGTAHIHGGISYTLKNRPDFELLL